MSTVEFGARARELILELKRSDWLPPFNDEGIRGVLKESTAIYDEVIDTLEGGRLTLNELPDSVKIGLFYHQASMMRNRRCLLAYATHRIKKIRELRWSTGPAIPGHLRPSLSPSEIDFFHQYDALLGSYSESFGLDLTADMEPPKELYIEVRVLEECGEIVTGNGTGSVHLEVGTTHLLKRSDVEHLVRQGKLQQIRNDD